MRVRGSVWGPYGIALVFTMRPESSFKEVGVMRRSVKRRYCHTPSTCVVVCLPCTNRSTSGFSLSESSVRFCKEINSGGNVRMPFLCKDKVFKLCNRATLDGIFPMRLSHKFSACNCDKFPMVSGTSRILLAPIDKRWRLQRKYYHEINEEVDKNKQSALNGSVLVSKVSLSTIRSLF